MWLSRRKKPEAVDLVWLTRKAKLDGILAAAREAASDQQLTLILAHFSKTRRELEAALRSSAIQHRILTSPFDLERQPPGSVGSGAGVVLVALTDELAPGGSAMPAAAAARVESRVRLLVAERYPLEERDLAVLSFAQASGVTTAVVFHSSLDDPLLTAFGVGDVTKLVRRLGADEHSPISARMITSALRAAQQRVKKRAIADHRVESAEEWFTYNMPS